MRRHSRRQGGHPLREALKPIRQGVKARFGAYGRGVAAGLSIRHDNGSQYTSDAFQDELRFLGAESSPPFVRSPEGNGCAERFIRTLKEQLLWRRTFATVEELRLALLEWAHRYNEHWCWSATTSSRRAGPAGAEASSLNITNQVSQ
ncbi:integrase core domain-containing protein [Pyxidicoccus caerfyrddinensis]|uniref:integrase core domain-containing protein n=1 Tax=Pyxidicoccus caerfyrddinensis TaxID=2709663 RepID=UPI0013DCDDAD